MASTSTTTPPFDSAQGKHIVILGGGYAGLRVTLRLRRAVRAGVCSVTLVDRSAVHVNPAVFYEVATAFNPYEKEGLGRVLHETASVPFTEILEGQGVSFLQKAAVRVDPRNLEVHCEDGTVLSADILVLTTGSQLATFNVPGIDTQAFSLKGLHEAVELRHHLVRQFLLYRSASLARQRNAFRVTVVGGGSAGVELAAELVLFLRRLARLHGVEPRIPEVVIFETSDILLREYPPTLRAIGLRRLRDLGVQIRSRSSVCRVGPDHLACTGNVTVPTDTVVWLAGIRSHDLLLRSGFPAHPRGGVSVEPTLQVKGFPNIFAAGDCVYAVDPKTKRVAPDVQYAALQQGTIVAENILRRLRGKPLISYIDRPRPTYATVGGKFALVHIPPLQFAGRLGWLMKQLADLKYLCGVLPNHLALLSWMRSVRVRVAND